MPRRGPDRARPPLGLGWVPIQIRFNFKVVHVKENAVPFGQRAVQAADVQQRPGDAEIVAATLIPSVRIKINAARSKNSKLRRVRVNLPDEQST